MFNVEELAKLAEAKQNVCRPLIEGGKLVQHNGYFYPMANGKLLNPLDAYNLIGTCDPSDDCTVSKFFTTLSCAQDIIESGCTIVARLNSKAPRVVQVGGDNGTVVILGDYAKEKDLYYPLLTALLADDQWDFDELWGAYGFKRPQFPNFCIGKDTYKDRHGDEHWHKEYVLDDKRLVYDEWDSRGCVNKKSARWSTDIQIERAKYVWDDRAKDF